MINVLINAYIVSPTKGNNRGWGGTIHYGNLFVIAVGNAVARSKRLWLLYHKREIFYYNPVPERVHYIC